MSIDQDIEQIIFHIKQKNLLINLLEQYAAFKMQPILGYEIEFYLLDEEKVKQLAQKFGNNFICERGNKQYELTQGPFDNLSMFIESIENTRNILLSYGSCLSPKPFVDDYGNGMHLHFSLIDTITKQNLFKNTQLNNFAASGICSHIEQTLYILLPTAEDYLRFDAKFKAPTHICYGPNNRSAAVRIPDSFPKRLEYRLCSNNTDPYLAVFSLLKSALIGITNKCSKYGPIFGNAYDPQYVLQKLPVNALLAKKSFKQEFFLQL